jgi:peptidoglycan/xylan/chitin deacetylase (PgdA/CDA1 family)
MYHYVRPYNEEFKFFNSLDVDIFKRQLDYFEAKYGFVSKDEYIETIKSGKNIDGVVLTFDDGFKDHSKYVMPELKKRGLWGLFYVSTGIYKQKKILGVHRVHMLMGKYGANEILRESMKMVNNSMLDNDTIEEFDKEIYLSPSYKDGERKLKRFFNYYLKYDFRDVFLDNLMHKYFDEDELFNDLYLSKQEILELVTNGNIVGSHTVSHPVLSRLPYNDQLFEIDESFKFIKNIIDQQYKSFCYPFGYKSSYNADSLNILKDLAIDDAVIFDNKIQKSFSNNYEISRIDCNQFLNL